MSKEKSLAIIIVLQMNFLSKKQVGVIYFSMSRKTCEAIIISDRQTCSTLFMCCGFYGSNKKVLEKENNKYLYI